MKLSGNSPKFVFMQVGSDPAVDIFVDSIRKTMPKAQIIQCSDYASPRVNGVSEVFRIKGNSENLMTFRLQLFAELNLSKPAIYIDNDMVLLRELDIHQLIGQNEVIHCKRYFNHDDLFNIHFKGMDLHQYTNKKLGDIYPILACFTITRNSLYWEKCLEVLMKLDNKFHFWYGDQEAMKILANSNQFRIGYLSEADVACLPEFYREKPNALALHFKGPHRKSLLTSFAKVNDQGVTRKIG